MSTPEAAPVAAPPARRRPSRAQVVVGLVFGLPALFLVFSQVHLRHVPWSVPTEWRPPAAPPIAAPARGTAPRAGLWVTYLGVTGYAITDGQTTILCDPTPTRPSGLALLAPIEGDPDLVARHCPRADFVLVNHTHHDHALDVPNVALHTGAKVVASPSTLGLCRSRGVSEQQLEEAVPGRRYAMGTFQVDVRSSRHTAIGPFETPMHGVVPANAGPLCFWEYTQDGCLAYRLEGGGTTLWFHPTSTYAPDELGGLQASALIVGVTGEDLTPAKAKAVLADARPRVVIPTHYDNFLQPYEKGLALMPGLDLSAAREAVRGADPSAAWWVLDYGQMVHLPPDAPPPGP